MRSHFVFSVVAGVLALCLCQWLQYWGGYIVYVPSEDIPAWRAALYGAVASVATVVPGLLAGFIAGRRGFLVGALVGALGSFLYGGVFELIQVHSGAIKLNARTWTVLFSFPTIYAAGLIISTTVAGGAGQLLRSNNRWRGP